MLTKCVIIDDDRDAIDILSSFIEEMPDFEVFKVFTSPLNALLEISENDGIDIIFIDIDMPQLSGLELAKTIRGKTKHLIFTTAHAEYAIKAFDLDASHYFLKPISFNKFAVGVAKFLRNEPDKLALEGVASPSITSRSLFIKGDNKGKFVNINRGDIYYVEGMLNYVQIRTKDETYVTYLGMNEIEIALGKTEFIRINRSYIVSKAAIKKVDGNRILLKNGADLPIGNQYKANFFTYLNETLLKSNRG
jgi:DNA-binding LytR/AlgR family response regulator